MLELEIDYDSFKMIPTQYVEKFNFCFIYVDKFFLVVTYTSTRIENAQINFISAPLHLAKQ